MRCPGCKSLITPHNYGDLHCYICTFNCGMWLTHESKWNLLFHEKVASHHRFLARTREKVKDALAMKCPQCRNNLHKVRAMHDYRRISAHVCSDCNGIFLNNIDFRLLRKENQRKTIDEETHRERRPLSNDEYYERYSQDGEIAAPEYLFSVFTGLPVEFNLPPQKPAMVTYVLMALNIGIFFALLGKSAVVLQFALRPDLFTDQLYTLITSMFLHGDVAHLLGNMYFLYVFGDNVEDRLGKLRYIFFYLLCGIVAALVHIALNTGDSMPMVGASGAIAGLMGAYLLACKKAKIGMVIFFFPFKMPAYAYFFIWMGIQLLLSITTTNIAWDAHLGGFFCGLICYPVFKNVIPDLSANEDIL